MKLRNFRLGSAARISIGLVALIISLFLALDLIFGLVPDNTDLVRTLRQRTSESLAVQAAALIEAGDWKSLQHTLTEVVSRDNQVLSVALRDSKGRIFTHAGDHTRYWRVPSDGRSTLTHVQVPIFADKEQWGTVEFAFRPLRPDSLLGWLQQPTVMLVLVLAIAALVAFYLYLRRVLLHLDPANAIPERVRAAFDSLAEGLIVLDQKGRIVLANATFRRWNDSDALYGKAISGLDWVTRALPGDASTHPWVQAMNQRAPVRGQAIEFPQPSGERVKAIVACARIQDGYGKTRGCMVTFNDVTELDRTNEQLRETLKKLDASREQIEAQNIELQHLASRDPMTGCLNRRAFFAALEPLFAQAREQRSPLCCIMTDIDHFKSFNDRYGHAVGDQVIQAVARSLTNGLGRDDLLCRYGGEEFCIVLPGASLENAAAVAERLRAEIERIAGSQVKANELVRITSSFGVAMLTRAVSSPADLLDQADTALYQAKEAGRNRVMSKRAA
jgi:diguanylate cyclase (GGDEF)-like protein/PAS domain S-box-containing protein